MAKLAAPVLETVPMISPRPNAAMVYAKTMRIVPTVLLIVRVKPVATQTIAFAVQVDLVALARTVVADLVTLRRRPWKRLAAEMVYARAMKPRTAQVTARLFPLRLLRHATIARKLMRRVVELVSRGDPRASAAVSFKSSTSFLSLVFIRGINQAKVYQNNNK